MARLIRVYSNVEEDVNGGIAHTVTYMPNYSVSENQKRFLFNSFEPCSLTHIFGWTLSDIDGYEESLRGLTPRVGDSGSIPSDVMDEWTLAWQRLFEAAPRSKRESFNSYTVGQFLNSVQSVKRQTSMWMPDVVCNCGSKENMAIIIGAGPMNLPNELLERMRAVSQAAIVNVGVFPVSKCSCCSPLDFTGLLNSTIYKRYSENRRGLCRCAGCR